MLVTQPEIRLLVLLVLCKQTIKYYFYFNLFPRSLMIYSGYCEHCQKTRQRKIIRIGKNKTFYNGCYNQARRNVQTLKLYTQIAIKNYLKKFLKIFPALSLAAPGEVGFEFVVFVVLLVVLVVLVVVVVTFVALLVPRGGFAGLHKSQHNNKTH